MDIDLNGHKHPWLIFSIKGSKFAISSIIVHGIIVVPEVTATPERHVHTRGMIHYQDTVIPIVDLRLRMGMDSSQDEANQFIQSMVDREAEHLAWLSELELSMSEGREFRETTDPHLCAFGQWYDNFKPRSHMMESLMRGFDGPHRQIHAVAAQVKALQREGKINEAYALIDNVRENDLGKMKEIFASVKKEFVAFNREISVVYESGSAICSFAADAVEGIEELHSIGNGKSGGAVLGHISSPLVIATARRKDSEEIIFVLDHKRILPSGPADIPTGLDHSLLATG